MNKSSNDSLSPEFWQTFVKTSWEQKTAHHQFPLQITEADLFEGMVAAAEVEHQKEQCNFNDPYRVAVDGCHILEHDVFSAFLPNWDDGDLNGYIARMQDQCDMDMGIQVSMISSYSPTIWQRVRNFLQPFFAASGVIPETIEIDLFLGKYEQTHFGVHRDADSTFTFGFSGQKQFRMWPLETFSPDMAVEGWPTHIQQTYYEQFRDSAQVVEVSAGKLLYWPSSVWHVGESPDSWSITLAVALNLKPDPYERIKAIMSALLPDPLQVVDPDTYPCKINQRHLATPPLAANLAAALDDIRGAVDAECIDIHLSLDWLKQASGCGLTATPRPLEVDLCDIKELRIDPRHPILWKVFSQNQVVIAANGYGAIISVAQHETLSNIIKRLNHGETLGNDQTDPEIAGVLHALASWRVFEDPDT